LSQPFAEDGVLVPLRPDDVRRAEGTPVSIEGTVIPTAADEPAADEPAADEPAPEAVEAAEAAAGRPDVLRFSPVPAGPPAPPVDAYSLRLVAQRKLYDQGTLVQHSPSLAPLAHPSTLRLHKWDFDHLGVAPGGRVKVISPKSSIMVDAVPDPAVPRGVAAMVANQAGPSPADLIDVTTPITEIRVETP
jgi:anaerobic selenocysteine-containing dehydrogenase